MKRILILLFIFTLAFSIRLNFITTANNNIESDEVEYDRLATNLMNGKGYIDSYGAPTSHRPPLYPALLAVLYIIFGHNYMLVKIIQAVIGSLTVCILYLTAEEIFGTITAMAAALFMSFYMTFVICTRLLFTETLFIFLLALIIFLIVIIKHPGIIQFCVLGVLCGLLTLLRSNGFVILLVAAAGILLKLKGEKATLSKIFPSILALALCFIAVLTPWIIRNYKVHARFVFVSTNAGLNMYQAVIQEPGKIYVIDEKGEIALKADAIKNEAEKNNFYLKAAADFYKEHPVKAMRMFLIRFLFFWNFIDWEISGGEVVNYQYLFILPFAILGTVFALKNRKEIVVMLLVILCFASFVLAFPGTARYRMPIDGYVVILGCYGIYEIIDKQHHKIYPVLSIGFYFFITYLLYRYSLQTKYFIKTLMEKIGLW